MRGRRDLRLDLRTPTGQLVRGVAGGSDTVCALDRRKDRLVPRNRFAVLPPALKLALLGRSQLRLLVSQSRGVKRAQLVSQRAQQVSDAGHRGRDVPVRSRDAIGIYVWVVGDSAPYGIAIDTPSLVLLVAEELGFQSVEDRCLRDRGQRWRTNGTRHQVALTERLIVFRRPPQVDS